MRKSIWCFTLAILSLTSTFSQETNGGNSIIGKWAICITDKPSKKFACENSMVFFEFLDGGNCNYYTLGIMCNSNKLDFISYNWKLNKDKLTFEESKWCTGSSSKLPDYTITWIDNNLFYSIGKEGKRGPKVYTYFKRVK